MELVLVIGGVVVLGLGALAVFAFGDKGPSEEEIFRRFDRLNGFTITERHAHEGTGLAADETRGVIAVLGKGREKIALLGPRDLAAWKYQPKDGAYEMTLKSYRHGEPFTITFRKSATADEWLKIFRKVIEDHG
ncbi:MAG: hypothetical protein RLY86_1421 [Pseudomonadota bacterium]|jgi:hypothetical protein